MLPMWQTALMLCLLCAVLTGCAQLGIDSPFTGRSSSSVSTSTSQLLGVPFPSGMRRSSGEAATQEGLETAGGNVDASTAALSMYSSLQSQGWQLRLSQRKGDRSVYLYERGGTQAVLVFRNQTLSTVLEIWVGQRLPDGAILSLPTPENAPVPGTTERWGGSSGGVGGSSSGSGIQERSL